VTAVQDAVDDMPGDMNGQSIHAARVFTKTPTLNYNGVDARTGFTNTSAADHPEIIGQIYHGGLAGVAPKFFNNYSGGVVAILMINYGVIENIEIGDIGACREGVYIHQGNVNNCIIHDLAYVSHRCRAIAAITGGNLIYNNFIYGIHCTNPSQFAAGIYSHGTGNKIYANSIYNVTHIGTKAYGIQSVDDSSIIKDNISTATANNDFKWNGGESAANTDYNCSEDATADDRGATHALINQDPTNDIKFVNLGAGTEDLHIQSGSSCIGAGVDLSGEGVTDDIDGDARPATPCMGADEYRVSYIPQHKIGKGIRTGVGTGIG